MLHVVLPEFSDDSSDDSLVLRDESPLPKVKRGRRQKQKGKSKKGAAKNIKVTTVSSDSDDWFTTPTTNKEVSIVGEKSKETGGTSLFGPTKRGTYLEDDYYAMDNLPVVPEAEIFTACEHACGDMLRNSKLFLQFEAVFREQKAKLKNGSVQDSDDKKVLEPETLELPKQTKKRVNREGPRLRNSVQDSVGKKVLEPKTPELPKQAKKRVNRKGQRSRKKARVLCGTPPTVTIASDSDSEVMCLENDVDRQLDVKIRCRREILRIPMKRSEKFFSIFPQLASHYQVKMSNILLCLRDRTVNLEDTPGALKITAGDILDCCVWNPQEETENSSNKSNCIEVKIQSGDSKTKTILSVHKLEPLSAMMEEYAKQRGVQIQKLVFKFDGEKILPTMIPMDLEMEDGSCIDVRII